jgi:PKD repeat protein
MKKVYFLFLLLSVITMKSYSQVSFTPDQTNACLPATINFTNNSSIGFYYIWDFGDGGSVQTTGLGSGTSHAYTHPGNYYVNVQAFDNSWNYVGFNGSSVSIQGLSAKLNTSDSTICPGDEASVDIA